MEIPVEARGKSPKSAGPGRAEGEVRRRERRSKAPKASVQAKGGDPRGKGLAESLTLPLVAAMVLVLLALGLAAFLILPDLMRVRIVEVHGNATLPAADVASAAGVVPGSTLFSNRGEAIEGNLAAYAPVASSRVRLVFPDRIRIDIVERRPAAFALVETGGSSFLVAIDASGVAYARVPAVALGDLPLLTGIRFEDWKPGQKLPDFILPSLASLAAIERTDPALLGLLSEIRLERSNWGEVELLLFPLHNSLPVRTGPLLDPDQLRSIVLVLDALGTGGFGSGVEEMDFRTGTIVFRTKEGHSG